MSVARELAQFFVAMDFDHLPPKVKENSQIVIADTVASALVGAHKDSVKIVRELVMEGEGPGEATLWATKGRKSGAPDAARVNAVMADALAVSESHASANTHIAGATVPAAIAVAERVGAQGRDLVSAVALGYEASGRIGRVISPSFTRFYHNSLVSIFGAAVAAGKLLGAGEEEMTHTIALAATSASGLMASRHTIAREFHAGSSALMGVNAALAASRGYQGLETILEHDEGYCKAYASDPKIDSIAQGLGEEWSLITDLSLKFIVASHGIHAPVEATLAAAKQGNIRPDDVEKVTVAAPRWTGSYRIYHPQDIATALHSMPYCVASALVDGESRWDRMSPEMITSRDSWELQERVHIVEDPNRGPRQYPGGATVTIITRDGKTYTESVDFPAGTPQRGFRWEQVDAKYRALAPQAGLSSGQIEAALQLFHGLDRMVHVSELTAQLVTQ